MATVVITITGDPNDETAFREDVELGVNRIVGSLGFTASGVEASVEFIEFPGATEYTIAAPIRRFTGDSWED